MLNKLSNNRNFANRKIYPICVPVAMIVLKQTNIYCMNVKMSKKYGMLSTTKINFDVSHKLIVVGFYHEVIYQLNMILRNLNIYKMWCRIEEKMNP